MIHKKSVYLVATGDTFSPGQAEKRLGKAFSEKNEPGDAEISGSFRGKPVPYGYGTLDLDVTETSGIFLEREVELLDRVDVGTVLRDCGATEITIYVNIGFIDQSNFEIKPAVLASISTVPRDRPHLARSSLDRTCDPTKARASNARTMYRELAFSSEN